MPLGPHIPGYHSLPDDDARDRPASRSDGSNEVTGIDPDVLIGFRSTDGLRRKGLRLAAALPRGITAALQLCKQARYTR